MQVPNFAAHRLPNVTVTSASTNVHEQRAVRACPEKLPSPVRPPPGSSPSFHPPRFLPARLQPPSFLPFLPVFTSVVAKLVATRNKPTLVTHSPAVAPLGNDCTGGHEGIDVLAQLDEKAQSGTPIPPAPSSVAVGPDAQRAAKNGSIGPTPPCHSSSFASRFAARDVFA